MMKESYTCCLVTALPECSRYPMHNVSSGNINISISEGKYKLKLRLKLKYLGIVQIGVYDVLFW